MSRPPTPLSTERPAPDTAEQAKRAARRRQRVEKGMEALDLWLDDLVRHGLAQVEGPASRNTADTREELEPSLWEVQAARLVDAQAPGLASRVRRLGRYVGSHPDWPARLLGEMGRLAMLTHAFRRLEELPAPLQADVRQLVGWSLSHDDVLASGESVADAWIVAGQSLFDEERYRMERSWLVGVRTGRTALLLQFAAGEADFAETLIPGTVFEAELVYWPSAFPQRAMIRARPANARGRVQPWRERLPGFERVEDFRTWYADALAQQPWLERTFACLRGVTPMYLPAEDTGEEGRIACLVRDAEGRTLPLGRIVPWSLFALSGGAPVDLAAEWNGESLTPIALVAGGEYHLLPAPPDEAP